MSAARARLGRVYLAARFSRNDEMRGVRDVLEGAFGVTVTSRWIDLHPDVVGEPQQSESAGPSALNLRPDDFARFAETDIHDLQAADTVVSFSSGAGANGKGGRHVEFGLAVALRKRLILVGPRENVFHTLPQVEHYVDWPALMRDLSATHLEAAGADR